MGAFFIIQNKRVFIKNNNLYTTLKLKFKSQG